MIRLSHTEPSSWATGVASPACPPMVAPIPVGINKATLNCDFGLRRIVIRNEEDLLLGYGFREIVVYRLSTGEPLARYGNDHHVEESFCLTGEYLIAEAPAGLVVFDHGTAEFRFLPTRTYKAYDSTPDGSVFTTAHRNELILWDNKKLAVPPNQLP